VLPTSIISGNQGHGIYSAASKTYVANVYVGQGPQGTQVIDRSLFGNGGSGVYFDTGASGSFFGNFFLPGVTTSGWNGGDGVTSYGARTTVMQVRIGIDWEGKKSGNKGNGVNLGSSAFSSLVGGNNFTFSDIGNNGANGILSAATFTRIVNVYVGANKALENHANGYSGVALASSAANSAVGLGWNADRDLTLIVNNGGDGVVGDDRALVPPGFRASATPQPHARHLLAAAFFCNLGSCLSSSSTWCLCWRTIDGRLDPLLSRQLAAVVFNPAALLPCV
jgi:hypothetical protein